MATRFLGVVVGLSVVVSGCAQSRLSHQPGLVATWDRKPLDAGMPAPQISLELYTRHLSFGEPSESPLTKWWSKQKLHEQLQDVLGEFPVLAKAQWDADGAPYTMLIEATHAIRGNKTLHWLSHSTHWAIPSSQEASIELDATLLQQDRLIRRYEAVGRYRIRRHLVFLALPWMWGYRVPSATMEDAFRDIFLQLQQDAAGLFGAGG